MGLFNRLFGKPPNPSAPAPARAATNSEQQPAPGFPVSPIPEAAIDDGFTVPFNDALAQVNALVPAGRYEEAAAAMLDFISATQLLNRKGLDPKRASAYGLAGIYLLNSGNAARAVEPLEKTVALCSALKDPSATSSYLHQLYLTYRYLGRASDAARCADRIAALCPGTLDEQSWKYRANLVRTGEPLVRILVVQNDRGYELPEVEAIKGPVAFAYERNRPNLDLCRHHLGQGDQLALEGSYTQALDSYRRAAAIDPYDPDPHYKSGKTFLLLQQYADAIQSFESAITLAPGWMTADSELWIARELLAGRLSHEAFLVLWTVENSQLEPDQRLTLIDQILAQFPDLPHLYFHRGTTLADLHSDKEALAAFTAGLTKNPEPDIRSRLLNQRAIYTPPAGQRILFQEILNLPNANLLARATAQIMIYRTPA